MILLLGCVTQEPAPYRWVRGYEGETPEIAQAGLRWALSLMGSSADDVVWLGDDDEAQVWFDGLDAEVHAEVDADLASERDLRGSADLGRFLMLSLYDPERYYRLVDAPQNFIEVSEPWLTYNVTSSLLTATGRVVRLPAGGCEPRCGPVELTVQEGTGLFKADGFRVGELERIDLMPNGQQRFMVYDADGQRISSSDGPAGPPGRCMWCHEDHLMRGVPEQNPAVGGGISGARFDRRLADLTEQMQAIRSLTPAVNWDEPVVHEYAELLVFSFLNPSADRLGREWTRTPDAVARALSDLIPVQDPEFPQLGLLYERAAADAVLAPLWGDGWDPAPVAASFR